ncbi:MULTISPECIES: HAD family hydrolase [unclassified Bradyrhizobium]|uniref:HAD family hydrolase n=1 Tax=unclassified Bradyrhizobium TaxID=2631580 RepID=UPI002915D728|nr:MULTISPECIES: HAD family hydrolase [unclassified Bradyrhizobium]
MEPGAIICQRWRMTIRLICLDADDTLWHNMRHFNGAEEAFLSMLEPFTDVGVARSALEACEARNLKVYGYGAKGFTLSLIETALELCGERLAPQMVRNILDVGRSILSHPVELLDRVEETLTELQARGRLVLVTKGDLLHQETKLAASGLGGRFSGVEIVSDKTTQTFRMLFDRYSVAPVEAIMAGDSMRSDVIPALDAGAWAAYVPQEGAWSHEQVAPAKDVPRYATLASLAELPSHIDRINRV